MKYQMILDQSTSGSKLLLLQNGQIIARYDKKHRQIFPKSGWVEHDPLEIWDNVEILVAEMLMKHQLQTTDITTLSITNQRETIVAWDKQTGKPLYNAIVWQCNRSAEICEKLREEGYQSVINQKTGLRIDPYFSGTKIKWLFAEVPAVSEAAKAGTLAIGTIDSWLIWKMTNGQNFATEASNACRTLLYNIQTKQWDDELLQIFDVPRTALPEIKLADDVFGEYNGIVIKGVMADSQAALYGEGCLETGDVKITIGTGCSVMMQLNQQSDLRDNCILTTLAWENSKGSAYALEGIIRSCGDAINWFSENVAEFDDIGTRCHQALVEDLTSEVYFIPALNGLGAPYWNNEATAAFIGMKRTTTQIDLLRSVLESILFQIKAVIETMEEVTEVPIRRIFVDGGMIKNRPLMELLATLLEKEIIISEIEEFSAYGVAMQANEALSESEMGQEVIEISQKFQAIKVRFMNWKKYLV